MKSVAVTPAPFSFRALILVGVLVAPMLLWSPMSFAFLSASLSPLYLQNTAARIGGCFPSGAVVTTSFTGGCANSLLGYVNTAQDPGTSSPLYFQSATQRIGGCFVSGTVVATGGCAHQLVGYVNATQIPGTSPLYLQNAAQRIGGCFPTGALVTTSFTGGCANSLLGYIYAGIPAPKTFTTFPKYFIGSVIYVPPGAGSSSITYGAGAVTGTTVSTTSSWSSNSQVTVSAVDNSSSVTLGGSFGGSTTHSVDMQQTSNQNTTYRAPPSDSINHDYDQIQIFLGVNVNASVDYLGNVTWDLDFSQIANQGFAETGYPISVGCLRSNSTIPTFECTATLNFLSSVGITSADYPSILGADPFADPTASPTPDHSRYVLIDSVAYLPDPTASTFTYTENNSTTITNSTTSTYSFSVGNSVSATYDFVSLKNANTFTWTHSSTQSNKTGSTNSSTFTLSNPSFAYTGPTTLFVYLDTIYKTFMFSVNQ